MPSPEDILDVTIDVFLLGGALALAAAAFAPGWRATFGMPLSQRENTRPDATS